MWSISEKFISYWKIIWLLPFKLFFIDWRRTKRLINFYDWSFSFRNIKRYGWLLLIVSISTIKWKGFLRVYGRISKKDSTLYFHFKCNLIFLCLKSYYQWERVNEGEFSEKKQTLFCEDKLSGKVKYCFMGKRSWGITITTNIVLSICNMQM